MRKTKEIKEELVQVNKELDSINEALQNNEEIGNTLYNPWNTELSDDYTMTYNERLTSLVTKKLTLQWVLCYG